MTCAAFLSMPPLPGQALSLGLAALMEPELEVKPAAPCRTPPPEEEENSKVDGEEGEEEDDDRDDESESSNEGNNPAAKEDA